jgi:hypothetical protein
MLAIFVLGLVVFLVSIGLGGLGLGRMAGWLAIAAMIVYFAGGLLRLSYD